MGESVKIDNSITNIKPFDGRQSKYTDWSEHTTHVVSLHYREISDIIDGQERPQDIYVEEFEQDNTNRYHSREYDRASGGGREPTHGDTTRRLAGDTAQRCRQKTPTDTSASSLPRERRAGGTTQQRDRPVFVSRIPPPTPITRETRHRSSVRLLEETARQGALQHASTQQEHETGVDEIS